MSNKNKHEHPCAIGGGTNCFRVKDEAGDGGEKVKGAVAKSIEKSKATVEESAKSAAEIAGKTVQKTKDKVKKSFFQSEL
ncbi:hypothetical protein Patl1_34945 [Pistacia atlantica]|uniref:Uncharacterized protein n=1 Tax=Pistacia atlantica TaxID=434234 RepID=A0ACC0ZTF1_9ROSI|nr:hypothetical protein Patl1_34945 [Pistacia atlantica]